MAEHHNMTGIASAATSVCIGFVAGGTTTIRVGSGGIVLPNHSPLQVAEQFGTLESLYPGRIRPWPGSGARHRSDRDACDAPRPACRRAFRRGHRRVAGIVRAG
jgi:alkanesulfonate monooxygenase SsuD/methylene tetrahydromethanopterin reductase-like flavin-dependent oxidoreductase (luciferase family)